MSVDCMDFESQVIERSQQVPVLVDFWAAWCQPCRMLGPVLERLAEQAQGRWELVKVDTEIMKDEATRFGIRSIPAVKLFHRGEVVQEFVGALPEAQIKLWLDEALPSPHLESLEQARRLLDQDQHARAVELIRPVVEQDPGAEGARLLLAEALLPVEPAAVLEALAPINGGSRYIDRVLHLRTLADLALAAEQPESLPEATVRDRFVEGAEALRRGEHRAALEAFIDVVVRQRDYREKSSEAACKAIFDLLGPEHPLTGEFRKSFASAMFS